MTEDGSRSDGRSGGAKERTDERAVEHGQIVCRLYLRLHSAERAGAPRGEDPRRAAAFLPTADGGEEEI